AEDGIRDRNVTGVQTCALPIYGADIMESAQHSSDDDSQMFYIRFEFYLEQLLDKQAMLDEAFQPLAESFSMEYEFTFKHRKKRVAIFVSKETHCLME